MMTRRASLEHDLARRHNLIAWEGMWIVREYLQDTDHPGREWFDEDEVETIRTYAVEWVREWEESTRDRQGA